MADLRDIDDGSALAAAKNGDLVPLLTRLKERLYLTNESLAWISDRLEGKKEGRQKTGIKQDKMARFEICEMYGLYRWLVDVEKLKTKEARYWIGRIYSGKDDTIRKELTKGKATKHWKIICIAVGLGGDPKKFLATKENKFRPIRLQKIGKHLSKK